MHQLRARTAGMRFKAREDHRSTSAASCSTWSCSSGPCGGLDEPEQPVGYLLRLSGDHRGRPVAAWVRRPKWLGLHRRRTEAAINAYEYDRVEVVGVLVHFVRAGAGPRPTLLILTNGWPRRFSHGSKVIDPLGR